MKSQQSVSHASPGPAAKKKSRAGSATAAARELAREAVSGPAREELIRLAAYELYQARGATSGHELEDWLQAESRVDQALANPGQTTTGTTSH